MPEYDTLARVVGEYWKNQLRLQRDCAISIQVLGIKFAQRPYQHTADLVREPLSFSSVSPPKVLTNKLLARLAGPPRARRASGGSSP